MENTSEIYHILPKSVRGLMQKSGLKPRELQEIRLRIHQPVIVRYAVSYTHLTLPTTPYV